MTLARERQKLAALLARLEGSPPPSSRELHEIWENRARPFWRIQPWLYTALTRKCRAVGENFLAIEVAEEGLAWFGEDLDPTEHLQLVHGRALAYASVGANDHARELIKGLGPERHASADALGLLARTHKDWFEAAEDPALRREHLLHARDAYRQALARVSDPYLAINAATTSLLLAAGGGPEAEGDRFETRLMAVRARKLCGDGDAPDAPPGPERDRANYWRLATLAECSLVLGEYDKARAGYRAAGEAGRYQRAELLATRRQTRLLLAALDRDPHEFDDCFPLPSVALFAGHMVDVPGRASARFPESGVPRVRERIAAALQEHHILIGYGSAACGADLLFLRAVLDRPGGEIHVVLPFERERFKHESVVRVPAHAHWGEEFDRVLASAASITELSDSPCWFEGNAFAFGNRVLHGMAEHKAREQGDAPVGFALWDNQPAGERIGGTADCLRQWAARGRTRVVISPSGGEVRREDEPVPDDTGTSLPVQAATDEETAAGVSEEIAGILRGEWEQPPAVTAAGERPGMEARARFFIRAAETLEAHGEWIVHRWVNGPEFRLIFRDLAAAGHAAHALREGTASLGGTLRLALHAGPVVRWRHPLMLGREEPAGIHLQKAARLAALPTNGRTHVSREYAALLEALPAGVDRRRLHCVYQGSTTLGEPFGRQALFALAKVMGCAWGTLRCSLRERCGLRCRLRLRCGVPAARCAVCLRHVAGCSAPTARCGVPAARCDAPCGSVAGCDAGCACVAACAARTLEKMSLPTSVTAIFKMIERRPVFVSAALKARQAIARGSAPGSHPPAPNPARAAQTRRTHRARFLVPPLQGLTDNVLSPRALSQAVTLPHLRRSRKNVLNAARSLRKLL